jgi:hypothetical protein
LSRRAAHLEDQENSMSIRIVIALGLGLLLAMPAAAQQKFRTPEAAVAALDAAMKAGDDGKQLDRLLGPEFTKFHASQTEDRAQARARFVRFDKNYGEYRGLSGEGDRRTLIVGAEGFVFPFPLVKRGGRWAFDGEAGVEELRNRYVGANEINAVSVLDIIVAAQLEYFVDDRDGDGVVEYATRIVSTPGQRDGLYWAADPDDPDAVESPLQPLADLAEVIMGKRGADEPFLGYHYHLLGSQDAAAKGGAWDYAINGHQVAGFAAIAWPAVYGDTGVKTFIINQDGVIYETDLGPDTEAKAAAITRFDPGTGWVEVRDEDIGAN